MRRALNFLGFGSLQIEIAAALAVAVAAPVLTVGALRTALSVGTALAVIGTVSACVTADPLFAIFASARAGRVFYFFGTGMFPCVFPGSKFSAFFSKLIHYYLRLKK